MKVDRVDVSSYTIPTDSPESDGTLEWTSTTLVVVEVHAGDETGLGYTYADKAAATVVESKLRDVAVGSDPMSVGQTWSAMVDSLRNVGRPGVASMALSAVDVALWDLKARLLDVPLIDLLDHHHDVTPIYGSGGFCSYSDKQLSEQLTGWAEQGIPRVKMKVGRDPGRDDSRLQVAHKAIGDDVELFVDANGAFSRKQALEWAQRYSAYDVRWFEEPVTSDDLEGLRLLRDRAPAVMDIAAGEYGFDLPYFRRMIDTVDCLQADVTRCGGITGFLAVGGLCDAATIDLSAHCAPQISAHACTAVWHLRHLEYFHDHVRIENAVFDGCLQPEPGGVLRPDRSRPGHGLTFKRADAERLSTAS